MDSIKWYQIPLIILALPLAITGWALVYTAAAILGGFAVANKELAKMLER